MNQNCHIIQDLLPLYVDDVLSEESKKFVEEHLKECEYCREMFNQMNHEFEVPSLQSDKEIIQDVKKKISFKTIFSVLFLVTYFLIWIMYYLDYKYTHVLTYTSLVSSGVHYEYSSYHYFIQFVVSLLPIVLLFVLDALLFLSIHYKTLKKNLIKIFVVLFMILFNNWVIAQEKKIAYGNYSGEITYVHSNQIEIDQGITFEIDDTLQSFVNENTRYRIYYRYNKETLVGKIDSIEKEQEPIKGIKDEKGKELADKYGASYVQVLNLLEDVNYSNINFDAINVHETSVEELELARKVYSSRRFTDEASDYWTYEIGNKVDLSSNYIAIVVCKNASGFEGETGIGFIHFPNDN